MKATLTLCVICPVLATAQISLSSADVVPLNTVVLQAHDLTPSVSEGGTGPAQTWNMSGLSTDALDTLNFRPYADAPNPAFSGAAGLIQFAAEPSYTYITTTASGLQLHGNSNIVDFGTGPILFDQVNTPAEMLVTFPNTYNTTYSQTYRNVATFYYGLSGIDSVRFASTVQKSLVTDAWGNMATPIGTFPVLRVAQEKLSLDTIYGYVASADTWYPFDASADSVAEYSFWTNGIGFPLVTITKDSSDNIASLKWLYTLPAVIDGLLKPEFALYPVPSDNYLAVECATAKVAVIRDLYGREVRRTTMTDGRAEILVAELPAALYLCSLFDADGRLVGTRRVSVLH